MFLATFSNISAQIISPSDLFVTNCNDQIDISTLISDPNFTIDLVAEDKISGTGYSYSFPVLSIFPGTLDGPLSYGTLTFQVPQTGEIVEITIYECCDAPSFDYILTIESVNQLPGYSGTFSGQTFLILDELRINDFTQFDGCQIYFGNDAKITVQGGVQLFIENQSELRQYCKYRWDGILAESSATEIRFIDSEITGSARGFFLETNVNFETTNGVFLDNTISIATLNFSTGGPYPGSSYVNVDGGRFEYGWIPVLAFHPNSTLLIEMDKLLYTPTSFTSAQVYISESSGVQIGIGSNTTNTFEVADDASVLSLESEATIANNYFLNCPSAIYGEESILIVGGVNTEQNTFEKSSFLLTNGAQYLQSNVLDQGSGIIQFPTNQTVNGQTGTYIAENSALSNSVLTINGSNNERRVQILNNNPWEESVMNVNNFETFSNATGITIFGNSFSSNLSSGSYQLALSSTPGVRVGGNEFILANAPPGNPVIVRPAIFAEDIPGAQIKDNVFIQRTIGFHGVGDLNTFNNEDFIISCNHFVHNETCMLFDPTTISHQANGQFTVDNTFSAFSSLPVPFVSINNLNSSLSFDYFYNSSTPSVDPNGPDWASINISAIAPINPNSVQSACVLQKQIIKENDGNFNFFPNPVSSNLIYFECESKNFRIQITDLHGKVLISQNLNHGQTIVNLNLKAGAYFIYFLNEEQNIVQTEKVIVL